MSSYSFLEDISLHIEGRISKEDALRQELTAKEILKRLQTQPGLILADEVGMGKTFVALAVAISTHLSDSRKRPVVVMVPSSLREKWPRDFETFVSGCLPQQQRRKLIAKTAERSEEFLKLLDDERSHRASVIFLTHGAMVRGLTDPWIKLALIQQALHKRHNVDHIWRSLYRFAGKILQLGWVESYREDIWEQLLKRKPNDWGEFLYKQKIDPSGRDNLENFEDPVPKALTEILSDLDLSETFEALKDIPVRTSDYLDEHLVNLRRTLTSQMKTLWSASVSQMKLRLPLLILDEAHHLKNADTQTASLFKNEESEGDAHEVSKGALANVFSRMLFLTATPFQLGHHELISVLDRFNGIDWNSSSKLPITKEGYGLLLEELRVKLDSSQGAALRLDRTWGTLKKDDLTVEGKQIESSDEWWRILKVSDSKMTPSTEQVLASFNETKKKMQEAQVLLSKWVIRHTKRRTLPPPFQNVPRRETHEGSEILLTKESNQVSHGLRIEGESLLPFLLAARAVACSPETRPVFAEGLASSYEAFLHTRKNREKRLLDDDEDQIVSSNVDPTLAWYLNRIEDALPSEDGIVGTMHPKIKATVDRTIALWEAGEKVLIFCHYVATGRTLRQAISDEISKRIEQRAIEKTGLTKAQALSELDKLGKRFYADPLKSECDSAILLILRDFPALKEYEEQLTEVVRRMLRTPSFLTRYFPLEQYRKPTGAQIIQSLKAQDSSGLTFEAMLREFFTFLSDRCESGERKKYIESVNRIQTGTHMGVEIEESLTSDERQGPKERLVANVRLANGDVRQETRQRLMLTFNTPFYPEILIASSVMAEGVDLHLNCRHVIHHDLSWNPSSLEQRTGRIDRIGAKAETCKKPIQIFLPFVAETQDEKMFRVVMDRERWFRVVMGEKYKVDAQTTETIAARIPFPVAAAEELAFKLSVFTENIE